ncbi:hypothetical protein FACS1894122_11370 [Alphaproteobacteria bacterium]|nr:hypothetical protein FACS1894122_11370 [Alphaproteobacteria bacterium]
MQIVAVFSLTKNTKMEISKPTVACVSCLATVVTIAAGNLWIVRCKTVEKEVAIGEYSGSLNIDNLPCGKGKLILKDGSVYEGDFSRGKLNGKGKMTYANGIVYKGDFVMVELNGTGKVTFADGRYVKGNYYEGDFKDGYPHGKGKRTYYDDETIYEGEFVKGKPHGNGKMTCGTSGTVDEGEFVDGKPCKS